jgi:hypothetical protein
MRTILLDAPMKNRTRQVALAFGAAALGLVFAGPADAQFAGGRGAFDQRERPVPVQFNDFFQPFWGGNRGYRNRGYDPYNPFTQRQPQAYESLKPPAPTPRKADAPPPTETVLVIGDQNADWLAYGLEEALADTPQISVVRRIKPYAGLIRYEPRADSPDWSQAVKEVLAADKPSAIVVMLGLNDRIPLRERLPPPRPATPAPAAGQAAGAGTTSGPAAEGAPAAAEQSAAPAGAEAARKQTPPPPPAPIYGPNYEFHVDKWGELYEKRIDEMIAVLKSRGVPVVWVGLPSIRGAKSTSDMSYLDELYRARAEKAGIVYVDIWDGFVDEQGHYTQQGPDFDGQTRRLRTYDGVNFTKYGAEKLAHYVEHELRRVLTSHAVPVALPGPEEPAPAKGTTDAKPAPGPVVPLNAAGNEGGELLGATKGAPQKKDPDPLAMRVLSRGEALAAPHGRADDFSWPRNDITSGGASAPPPAASPPPSGGSGKTETNKTETNKSEGNKPDTSKAEANKGEANKTDANKSDASKAEPKKPAAGSVPSGAAGAPSPSPNATPARPRQTNQDLDGGPPPRPPAPVGPAAAR